MYAIRTTDIAVAAKIIEEGRVVAIPTGTSYGLVADALKGHSLQRVRNLKKRPQEKPMSIFLSQELWDEYFNLSHEESRMLEQYAHTALTLLVHPKKTLEHLSQDGRVGLRMIDHPMMQQLADMLRRPLTATSANISGEESAYTPDEVERAFPGRDGSTYDLSLGCILDGGTLLHKEASTVAKMENGALEIIRQGSLMLV